MVITFSQKISLKMAMSARDIYASYGEREKIEPIVIINKKVIQSMKITECK